MTVMFWISYVLLWTVVAVQSFALLEVMRQIAAIRRRVGSDQGAAMLPVDTGAALPEMNGIAAAGYQTRTWSDYIAQDIGIAVFVTPNCIKCKEVAEELGTLAANLRNRVDVVAVVQGPMDLSERFIADAALPRHMTVIDEEGLTASRLGINVTPAAVTLIAGSIGIAGIVNDARQVEALLDSDEAHHSALTSEQLDAMVGATT